MAYHPSAEILNKYAEVLVNFALGGGTGIKPGQTVFVQGPTSALPFYSAINKAIIDSGGITIGGLYDDTSGMARYFIDKANEQQLTKFLRNYSKGLVADMDHRIAILSDYDVHELDGVDPKKIMLSQKSRKPLIDWLNKKENQGKYTWTLALYGTPSMAKEAKLSEKEYWQQIIHANYLDFKDPIAKWRKTSTEVQRVAKKLTDLKIDKLHIEGEEVDLHVTVGQKRRWLGGGGRNIPSFEVFTSPDWRGTDGWIKFNQPLYRYGSMVTGIEMHFKNGRVVKATAKKNQNLLTEMLKTDKGASQMGEFSLTDKRVSRITKFMAETLFDENMGGKYGNTHLAVGASYHDTYDGDITKMKKSDFSKLGYNDSVIHTDMISTTDRTVTATLKNGSPKIIYKDGQFTI
jgi:aminopeptidase